MRKIDTDYVIWALLCLPAAAVAWRIWGDGAPPNYERLSWRTAEVSGYLLILTMMITPLGLLTKGRYGTRWLMGRRRYFGVASLGYGILHMVFYFLHTGLPAVVTEALWFNVWTGYLLMAIMLPLGWTSRTSVVRRMGPRWKRLQRWAYPAAALTFVHWACQFNWSDWSEALLFFSPLLALSIWRVWRMRARWSGPQAAQ